jgi:hypothetical protein
MGLGVLLVPAGCCSWFPVRLAVLAKNCEIYNSKT